MLWGEKKGDLAKDLGVLGVFSYQIFLTVQDVLKLPGSRRKGHNTENSQLKSENG